MLEQVNIDGEWREAETEVVARLDLLIARVAELETAISAHRANRLPHMTYPSRIFEHPNPINFKCPICHSKADAPVVLVAIPGTEDDGIVECQQVHRECYDLHHKMNNTAWV